MGGQKKLQNPTILKISVSQPSYNPSEAEPAWGPKNIIKPTNLLILGPQPGPEPPKGDTCLGGEKHYKTRRFFRFFNFDQPRFSTAKAPETTPQILLDTMSYTEEALGDGRVVARSGLQKNRDTATCCLISSLGHLLFCVGPSLL